MVGVRLEDVVGFVVLRVLRIGRLGDGEVFGEGGDAGGVERRVRRVVRGEMGEGSRTGETKRGGDEIGSCC